jgi:hypothetical protein
MSRGVAGMLREARDRYLASLVSEEDKERLLDAARKTLLDLDPELQGRPKDKLVNGPLAPQRKKVLDRIRKEIERAYGKEAKAELDRQDPKRVTLAVLRTLMAYLVDKGLRTSDRKTLNEAMLGLHEMHKTVQRIRKGRSGSFRTDSAVLERRTHDLRWLRRNAFKLQSEHPDWPINRLAGEPLKGARREKRALPWTKAPGMLAALKKIGIKPPKKTSMQ